MTETRPGWPLCALLVILTTPVVAQVKRFDLRPVTGVGAGFGHSLELLGDVDGDGVGDIAVGAPADDTTAADAGLVVVFSGRTSREIWRRHGSAAADQLGSRLVAVGDVNLDGVPDVLASATGAMTALGARAWV